MIKTLYEEKEVVLSWLRDMPKAFRQWLEETYLSEINTLKSASDAMYFYRSQGRFQILERLIGLERELQQPMQNK